MANAWLHRLALTTAGTTLFLLFVGALVTSKGVGLAVPDWPTTFGHNMFLFPWARMVGGVFYEHSHRLVASGVGFLTLVLAVCLWLREPRAWIRWLGAATLLLVTVQGVVGGLRVVLLEQDLAIVHAALAQAFFGLIVAMALFTSRQWAEAPPRPGVGGGTMFQWFCLATTLLIYAQSLLGAVIRHTGTAVVLHVLMALVVAVQIGLLVVKAHHLGDEVPVFRTLSLWLGLLLVLQLALGTGAYAARFLSFGAVWQPSVIVAVTTGHVVTGALLFALSVVTTLWAFRILGFPGRLPVLDEVISERATA
jgi:cytochrome c oxidase assembly protein subunit 15